MSPIEALEQTMLATVISDRNRRCPEPGGLVKRMNTKVREALSKLTSDDLSKMRFNPAYVMGYEYTAKAHITELKRAFDQQLPN
jgi:hypothetical protein